MSSLSDKGRQDLGAIWISNTYRFALNEGSVHTPVVGDAFMSSFKAAAATLGPTSGAVTGTAPAMVIASAGAATVHVGKWLVCTGSTNAANDGTYLITAVSVGASFTIRNSAGVATGSTTWSVYTPSVYSADQTSSRGQDLQYMPLASSKANTDGNLSCADATFVAVPTGHSITSFVVMQDPTSDNFETWRHFGFNDGIVAIPTNGGNITTNTLVYTGPGTGILKI